MAEGTPEVVVQEPRSYTGHYLKPLLKSEVPAVETPSMRKKRTSTSVREREAAE